MAAIFIAAKVTDKVVYAATKRFKSLLKS